MSLLASIRRSGLRHWPAALALAFVLSSGPAQPDTGPSVPEPKAVPYELPRGDPGRGAYVFEAYCVSCHGPWGQGNGPVKESLEMDVGVTPANLASAEFHQSRSDLDIARAILGGGEEVHKSSYMPPWGQAITVEQACDLVAFIRELRNLRPVQPETSIAVVDELELGRYLYITRCLACHGPEGRGDGPFLATMKEQGTPLVHPPDLGDYDNYLHARSDATLESTISMGFEHTGWPIPQRGWWDRALRKDEMRALIFYLRSLSLRTPRPYGQVGLPTASAPPTPK